MSGFMTDLLSKGRKTGEDERLPKNESLADHRKKCKAQPGNCPFEKNLATTAKREDVVNAQSAEGDQVDQKYIEALYKTDINTCSRMVREAAKKRMKNPILDVDGLPKVFYSGAVNGFRGNRLKGWLWLSDDRNVALGYTIDDEDPEDTGEKPELIEKFFIDATDADYVEANQQDWDSIDPSEDSERTVESTDTLASTAFANGKSMVIIRHVNDWHDLDHNNENQTVVCVFDKREVNGKRVPNNVVKLADWQTNDDSTESYFIPLSKRFDMNNRDIRY